MIGHSRNGKLWLVVWFKISLCIILRVYVKIKMQQMQHRDSMQHAERGLESTYLKRISLLEGQEE